MLWRPGHTPPPVTAGDMWESGCSRHTSKFRNLCILSGAFHHSPAPPHRGKGGLKNCSLRDRRCTGVRQGQTPAFSTF
ncbi:hypothetical protein P7K49_012110 [Saguinus oedipus]|uniref:Uncharacterized protein n=1 Tax=Saguinus oedipus TaxID=9490 RepID=A0ABQ9VSJ6_SAGOE|nr:hypothetical protein P7K49_012110 [Saguinus oedipus]